VVEAASADGSLDAIVEDARALLPALLRTVAAAGARVQAVEVAEPNLEAVFLHLTGRALRD
jgi:ABC-2 type transport system ATP-binding protein